LGVGGGVGALRRGKGNCGCSGKRGRRNGGGGGLGGVLVILRFQKKWKPAGRKMCGTVYLGLPQKGNVTEEDLLQEISQS